MLLGYITLFLFFLWLACFINWELIGERYRCEVSFGDDAEYARSSWIFMRYVQLSALSFGLFYCLFLLGINLLVALIAMFMFVLMFVIDHVFTRFFMMRIGL